MTIRRIDPATVVSPKVPAATVGGAAATVLAYLLGTLPVIDGWPDPVRGALLVLLMAAGAFAAGYLKRDPLRRSSLGTDGAYDVTEVPPPGAHRMD